jgi:DNA-directed RNA polymerase specialized sigma24 family protein
MRGMSTGTKQARVPVGVPTGGQFAADRKSESSTATLLPNAQKAGSPLTAEHLPLVDRAIARNMARYRLSRNDLVHGRTPEDIQQDAYIEVLDHINKRTRTRDPRGYIHTIVSNQFEQAFRGNMTRAARKANAIYSAREMAQTQRLGRSLSVTEKNQIEQDIYDGWEGPKKNRPPRNFRHQYLTSAVDSIDRQVGGADGEQSTLDPAARFGLIEDSAEDISLADDGDERIDSLLDDRAEAPAVTEGVLPKTAREKHRRALEDHPGGLAQAIADYNDGHDSPATEAIFAAWQDRDLSTAEKDRIIQVFESSSGSYRDDLWKASVSKADSRMAARRAARRAG